MLGTILPVLVPVLSALAPSLFGYLGYRAYTGTVRHVVDTLGSDGLAKIDKLQPPTMVAAAKAISARRQARQ